MKGTIFRITAAAAVMSLTLLLGSAVAFAAEIDSADEIDAPGDYTLASDIEGSAVLSDGTYTIDLNGNTWTGSLTIQGASVTITDSSSDHSGLMTAADNDVIMAEDGSLTATGIKIEGNASGCDGIFVTGGKVVINDCTITAISSAVQNKGGEVTINGGTYSSGNNALKVNNDSIITVNGAELSGDLLIGEGNTTNNTIEKAFIAGDGYRLVISERSEDETKIVKASFEKEEEEKPEPGDTEPEPEPVDPGKQPNTGELGYAILLAFSAVSAFAVLKKKSVTH